MSNGLGQRDENWNRFVDVAFPSLRAQRSNPVLFSSICHSGLLRRFAPRNDVCGTSADGVTPSTVMAGPVPAIHVEVSRDAAT
jgi:hypothetical protein